MKTIKELDKLMKGSYTQGHFGQRDIGYKQALKDVLKLIDEFEFNGINLIQRVRIKKELKARING